MHKTKTHYYIEPYAQTLQATIISLDPYKGRVSAILDQTICYPEGGGQPGDRGTLNSIPIVDTIQDESGQILHILGQEHDFTPGDTVTIRIDWAHRYDYMQQHTAQHLLSGLLYTLLQVGTLSVHLGHDDLSIEIDTPSFSTEDAEMIEDAVNAEIRKNVPVSTFEVTQEDSMKLGLRRPVKVDGNVRIVQIGDADTIACGGVHVRDTSELLYIGFLRTEKIRGRIKTYWVAGKRSIDMMRRNLKIIEEAGTLLSLPAEEIVTGISSLQNQLSDARYQVRQLSSRFTSMKFSQYLKLALKLNGIPLISLDITDWEEEEFKNLPETLLSISEILLCVVRERTDGKLAWMVAVKGFGSESDLFQSIRKDALPLIDGKGGGKPPLWQGVGHLPQGKTRFLDQVMSLFRGYMDVKAL
jgi:alanyl-tRNA synthetase